MTKEQLAKCEKIKRENPSIGRISLAKAAGVSLGQARRFLKDCESVRETAPAVIAVKKVKTLADFRSAYDKATIVPAKVKEAIKSLGSHGWEYEVPFAKMAGVSIVDLAMFREPFSEFIVNLKDNKRAWAGSVKTAKTMREML